MVTVLHANFQFVQTEISSGLTEELMDPNYLWDKCKYGPKTQIYLILSFTVSNDWMYINN